MMLTPLEAIAGGVEDAYDKLTYHRRFADERCLMVAMQDCDKAIEILDDVLIDLKHFIATHESED